MAGSNFQRGKTCRDSLQFWARFFDPKFRSEQKLEKSTLCRHAHPSSLGDSPLMKTGLRSARWWTSLKALGLHTEPTNLSPFTAKNVSHQSFAMKNRMEFSCVQKVSVPRAPRCCRTIGVRRDRASGAPVRCPSRWSPSCRPLRRVWAWAIRANRQC